MVQKENHEVVPNVSIYQLATRRCFDVRCGALMQCETGKQASTQFESEGERERDGGGDTCFACAVKMTFPLPPYRPLGISQRQSGSTGKMVPERWLVPLDQNDAGDGHGHARPRPATPSPRLKGEIFQSLRSGFSPFHLYSCSCL